MADEGRVTKVVVEALGDSDPPGRITKTVVEALGNTDPAARVTKVVIEVLAPNVPPTQGQLTQSVVEVMAGNPNSQAQITQSAVEVMAQDTVGETRVSQYSVELLVPFSCPTFEIPCPDLPPPCPVPNETPEAGPSGCPVVQPAPATPSCVGIVPEPPCPEVD